jgi:hypothetical protein
MLSIIEGSHSYSYYFLRSSAQLRKAIVSFACLSVCLSTRPHGITLFPLDVFSEIRYSLVFLKKKKLFRIFKFDYNPTRITGTLHEDICTRWFKYDRDKLWLVYTQIIPVIFEPPCTFMTISRWILLKMRNVLGKSCRESQNTHFMFYNSFPKIVPFMRCCGKIWYSQTGHRWQCDMGHALCMQDT